MGIAAFADRADAGERPLRIDAASIVDDASAADPANVDLLETADLIYLPGGDPDLIPKILPRTKALAAIETARRRGAVVAGASAGGMALAEWSWTPDGGIRGLGFVAGFALLPHYNDGRRTAWQTVLDRVAPEGIGHLGLEERTGALSDGRTSGGRSWRIAGPGAAYWFARGARRPIIARDGETIDIPD
jgi:putative intracellular protease/amidase